MLEYLDSLPIPDYGPGGHYLIDKGELVEAGSYYDTQEFVVIHSTRGCPRSCTYCYNSFLKKWYENKGVLRKAKE
ncbi:MAG: hypothetical protein HGA80_07655 [Candidatus Omnitrophica bacterium]|nr:hypothetical protein [Candidatus Omnitrophota bacterium]